MGKALVQASLFEWTQKTVAAEHDRRKNNKAEVRALLADGQRHTNMQLVNVGGLRAGARVYELRAEGLVIHRYATGPGAWSYRLDPSGDYDNECEACPRCITPRAGDLAEVSP